MCVLFCEINYYLSFLVLNLLTHSLTYCGIVSMMQKHCRSAPSNSFKCFFWIKMIYVTSNLSQNVPGCSVCICPQTCHHSLFVYTHWSLVHTSSSYITRSIAAAFGWQGMPPPASNDTGTGLGQDGSDWSCDLATFDLGDHGDCGWCGLMSSIRIPSLKFVGLAVRKIWCTTCVSINRPGMTLAFDLWGHASGLWLMRVVILHLYTKFDVCRPCHSEDMVHDVCRH